MLETELLTKPDFGLILLHELFHFVWARLGNRKRASYAELLVQERRAKARGELGESAAVQKATNCETRDYVCESFCDTAAWLYASTQKNPHANLAKRWSDIRKTWFVANITEPVKC